MEEGKKICSLCEQQLTYDKFYTYKKYGTLWAYCKKCHYEKYTKRLKKTWDKQNPERLKEINKKASLKWVAKNKQKINAYNRERYKQAKIDKQNGI